MMIIISPFIFAILAYASIRDIKSKEVADKVHIAILILAIIKITYLIITKQDINQITDMAAGMIISALPLLTAAIATQGKGIGGADIKLMGATGLLIGTNAILALIIGLILAVTVSAILIATKKIKRCDTVPLVPYLSAGIIITIILNGGVI